MTGPIGRAAARWLAGARHRIDNSTRRLEALGRDVDVVVAASGTDGAISARLARVEGIALERLVASSGGYRATHRLIDDRFLGVAARIDDTEAASAAWATAPTTWGRIGGWERELVGIGEVVDALGHEVQP